MINDRIRKAADVPLANHEIVVAARLVTCRGCGMAFPALDRGIGHAVDKQFSVRPSK